MAQLRVVNGGEHRTDAELVAAVADREHGALELLYRRHEPWLTPRLTHRCNDRGVVEEAVQEPSSWSGEPQDATTEAARWPRGSGVSASVSCCTGCDLASAARSAPLVRNDDHPRRKTGADRCPLRRCRRGARSLSPELRAVVQATVFDGLSCEEAARTLGIPAGAVKTRMMRAKRELREALYQSGMASPPDHLAGYAKARRAGSGPRSRRTWSRAALPAALAAVTPGDVRQERCGPDRRRIDLAVGHSRRAGLGSVSLASPPFSSPRC